MKIKYLLVLFSALILSGYTQEASLHALQTIDGAVMLNISDNGRWSTGYTSDGGEHKNASYWDLVNLQRIQLVGAGTTSEANDITDDGSIVVGSNNNIPGYWEEGIWSDLPLPLNTQIGSVKSVTPDGSVMVGRAFPSSYAFAVACQWENGELVNVNHANVDKMGETANFNEMIGISADGSIGLGCLNYTYLPNRTAFLMFEDEYFMFGSEYYDPFGEGNIYNFYDFPYLSPNGNWITGEIYWVEQDFSNEYWCPFRYDVENDITELFLDDIEVAGFVIDNNGNAYGVTPLNYPIRDALKLMDGQWVSFDSFVENEYGIDITAETGYEKLGNIYGVSADGNTIIGSKEISTYNWVFKITENTIGTEEATKENIKVMMKGNSLVMQGKIKHLSIFSAAGANVVDEEINSLPIINLSHLPKGVYLAQITDIYGNTITEKIYAGTK